MSSDKLTSAITDGHAEVDGTVEDSFTAFRARYKELLLNLNARNLVMWKQNGVDAYLFEATPQSLAKKNAGMIGAPLQMEMAGLFAACKFQAMSEIVIRDIAKAAFRAVQEKHSAAKGLTRVQLVQYAKATRKKLEFEEARARRTNGKANAGQNQQP